MSVLDKDIFPALFNKKLKAFKWQKKQIYIIRIKRIKNKSCI